MSRVIITVFTFVLFPFQSLFITWKHTDPDAYEIRVAFFYSVTPLLGPKYSTCKLSNKKKMNDNTGIKCHWLILYSCEGYVWSICNIKRVIHMWCSPSAVTSANARQESTIKQLTVCTLTPACIISLVLSIHLVRYWKGEFVWRSRAVLFRYHFFCSPDFNVWFSSDNVRRNRMLVTQGVKGLRASNSTEGGYNYYWTNNWNGFSCAKVHKRSIRRKHNSNQIKILRSTWLR